MIYRRVSFFKTLILLISFMFTACSNTVSFEPKSYYLPEATIGKPYRQVIHLHTSSAVTAVNINTWPDDAGLDWQYSRVDSSYWDDNDDVKGNAIEIIGIPTDNPQKEIKIGVWGSALANMWPGTQSYKEYIIKLIPDSAKPIVKQ